ncbi:7837_t:CDS:10 [Funneliformis mosseae]|uniref:7837_t:CDS:1 n=1 Tax=Funneliformis mosseae TaxID=27381 RepID=A0A9N9CVU8_FUNMO|nr:7837_t:CDS:10 [Funneliformis mosseae]
MWSLDGLEGRLKEHSEFIDSLMCLIPPKHYFKNDPNASDDEEKFQPNKKKRIPKQVLKEQKKQAKRQKLDPNNLKTVQELQIEKLHKIQQEKQKEKEQKDDEVNKEEDDEDEDDDEIEYDVDVKIEKKDSDEEQIEKDTDDEEEEENDKESQSDLVDGAESDEDDKNKIITVAKNNGDIKKGVDIKKSGSVKRKIDDVHLKVKLQDKIVKIGRLKRLDPEKAAELQVKEAWDKAFLKAQGEKVKDDPKLLAKTIKKKIIKKRKSEKAWEDRIESVEKSMAERQKTRTENIKARIDAKNKKKKNKRK